MNVKKIIASNIKLENIDINLESLITENPDKSMGDYSIACFSLAKILRKSPLQIANDIKENFNDYSIVEKVECVNGYVNFFLNKKIFVKDVLTEIYEDNFLSKNAMPKTICLDYSSVNLAKYMHIGHLSTTIIGESLARIYEENGNKVVRINYIGDYGTPFGKMIYAHLTWGNDEELNARGVDYLQDLYVEFCKRANDSPILEEYARDYFKKICDKDPKIYPLFLKFIEISKVEAKRLLDLLDVHFDSWKGESSYSEDLDKIVKLLDNKNLLIESQGAKVVDLEKYNLGTCLIQKSDGTSLYATRDICAAIDRYNTYKFDKMIYVTAVQQKLHFEQFFKVLELLGYDFSKNLCHIYYGMFSLPTGKIASRKGKQAVLVDLMDIALKKVNSIISEREFSEENKNEIAKKIAYSALKYTAIKNERIKDTVFDIETAFNFDGDTSAYLQYTYTRICSILRKSQYKINFDNIDYSHLSTEIVTNIILALNNYSSFVAKAMEQNEPSILCKYTLDICKMFNKFYNQEKVITEDKDATNAKLYLLVNIKKILTRLFHLICIDTIEEM